MKLSYLNDFGTLKALAVTAVLGWLPANAHAITIEPGYDLFETVGTAFVDLSDQGFGIVALEGNNSLLDSDEFDLGTTDTIIRRNSGLELQSGESGFTDIEVIALSLQSQDTLNIGGIDARLFLTIDRTEELFGVDLFEDLIQPDLLPPSLGRMRITEDNNGGTFDSCFGDNSCDDESLRVPDGGVYANVILADVSNPNANPFDNILASFVSPVTTLQGVDTCWTGSRPANSANTPPFTAGGFYVCEGEIHHQDGPHPVRVAQTPIPAGLWLFLPAIAAMIRLRKKGKIV